MNAVGFRLGEAVVGGAILPLLFCFFHWIDGTRPLITEFEAGAIVAVVILKLIEALRATQSLTEHRG
jgi:hypothetical protein